MTLAWLPFESAEAARVAGGDVAGVEVGVYSPGGPVPEGADRVEFVVLPNAGGPDAWAALSHQELPRLRAVQLGSAGYDHMTAAMPPGVRLCNAAGVHDAGTAELALALALANLRGLDVYARDQAAHRWQGFFAPSLADRRALIFGYGRIGAAVERRLAPFEPASVVRVARRPRSEPEVHPVSELLEHSGLARTRRPHQVDDLHLVVVEVFAVMTRGPFVVGEDTFVYRHRHDVAVAAST